MFNRYTSKQTYRTVPPSLGTPEEARRTVETAEADFEARLVALSAAVSRECAEDGIRILRLTGPTCSGKTTAAGKLTEALEAAGLSVYPISLDDFYLDRQELEERARARGGTPDYDSADTLDLGAMEACVRELRRTGETDIPVFNFTTGNRAGTRHLAVPAGKKPVFLFEGIQALYPPVTALFADIPSRSVYISALHGLEVAGGGMQGSRITDCYLSVSRHIGINSRYSAPAGRYADGMPSTARSDARICSARTA